MNKLNVTVVTAGLLGLALASSAVAQQTDFPTQRSSQASCEAVEWNANMLENHPKLIGACQEVIVVDGESWARFDAQFKAIERNGQVVFNVLDRRDRPVEDVSFMPVADQVAYINDRATQFGQLRTTDKVSLYVPEGQYGFSTQPGVPGEQVAEVVAPPRPAATTSRPVVAERTAPAPAQRTVAQTSTRPTVLPSTASSLPWFALAGFLSLLGGMILTLRR